MSSLLEPGTITCAVCLASSTGACIASSIPGFNHPTVPAEGGCVCLSQGVLVWYPVVIARLFNTQRIGETLLLELL